MRGTRTMIMERIGVVHDISTNVAGIVFDHDPKNMHLWIRDYWTPADWPPAVGVKVRELIYYLDRPGGQRIRCVEIQVQREGHWPEEE